MIREHEFNSKWLGYNCGFMNDLSLFSLSPTEQDKILNEYQWIELRTTDFSAEKLRDLHTRGFWQVDTQVKFSLDLTKLPQKIDAEGFELYRASEKPFMIEQQDIWSFANERFLSLPGVTQKMVDERYVTIANKLIESNPEWCFCFTDKNKVQGWYFATPQGTEIDLTLAMRHKDSYIRGRQLYHLAISHYAKNFTLATARFSITNVAVHNILAKLGARFLDPEGVWFWMKDDSPKGK